WEEIRILEIINYATYDQPQVLFETMGFGKPLDHTSLLLAPGSLTFAWGGTVRLLAEGLGVELETILETHERRPATRPIRIGPPPRRGPGRGAGHAPRAARAPPGNAAHPHRRAHRRAGDDGGAPLRGAGHHRRAARHRGRARDPPGRRPRSRLADGEGLPRRHQGHAGDALRLRVRGRA